MSEPNDEPSDVPSGVPAKSVEVERLVDMVEALFDEVIDQQAAKVLVIANEVHPGLTSDDVMQPHDFADLYADPIFQFEDGILAGLRAAQVAVRSRVYRDLGFRNLPPPGGGFAGPASGGKGG